MPYDEFVRKLTSPHFHGDLVGEVQFSKRMTMASHVGASIDAVKKALFYGKADSLLREPNASPLPAPYNIDLFHAVLGLITESIELLEGLYKSDPINILEELGDLRWYYQLALNAIGESDEAVRAANVRKLTRRYADKFTATEANERNLSAERAALEE